MNQIDQLDPHPMWETFAHEIPDRYARSGGIAELVAGLDHHFDVAASEQLKRVTTLDELTKTTLKEAWRRATSTFEKGLLDGLIVALHNTARRLAGLPEDAVDIQRAPDGTRPPFGSMASALSFVAESTYLAIGTGPLTSVVAETSMKALALGRAAERVGRDRGNAGGFIPVEWMASSPTHVGGSSAKNEDRLLLAVDVRQALDKAMAHKEVLDTGGHVRRSLLAIVLGAEEPVPAKRKQGEPRKGVAQYERVRLTMRDAARFEFDARREWARDAERDPDRYTAEELAESEEAIRERIGRAKKAFQKELERCKLVPAQVERAPRPPAKPQRVSAFAEGWS